MKNYILCFVKQYGWIPVFLLCSAISMKIMSCYNFSALSVLVCFFGSLGVCVFTMFVLDRIDALDGDTKEKLKRFEKEVNEIKDALSINNEIDVNVRKTTEIELEVSECKAHVENGKIVCKIKLSDQEVTFDSYEEFANFFCLYEEEK